MTYRPLFFDLYLPFRYNKILQTGDYNGFIFIIYRFFGLELIVWLLLKDKTTPVLAFILVSAFVGALLMIMDASSLGVGKALGVQGDVLNFKVMKGFIADEVKSVSNTAALFVFSILFFSTLSASGFSTR